MLEDREIDYIKILREIKYNSYAMDPFNEVYVLPPFEASHMGKVVMALDYSKKRDMEFRERGNYLNIIHKKIKKGISGDNFILYDLEAIEETVIKSRDNSENAKESLDLRINLADISLDSPLQDQWKAKAELSKRRAEELYLSDQENRGEKRLRQAYKDVIAEKWGEQECKKVEEEVDRRVTTPDTGVKKSKSTSLEVGGSSKDMSGPG